MPPIAARTVNKERARHGDQLYAEARHRNVKGRSNMNKAQLQHAVDS